MEKIIIQSELCDGCQDCEHTCDGLYSTSRISIQELDSTYYSIVCQQCETAPCAIICPTEAMEQTGVNAEKCIGCGLCAMVCPFGAVHIHDKVANKCDQCKDKDESPACIQACSKRALSLIDPDMLILEKQKEYLSKFQTMGKKPKMSFISVLQNNAKASKILTKE